MVQHLTIRLARPFKQVDTARKYGPYKAPPRGAMPHKAAIIII